MIVKIETPNFVNGEPVAAYKTAITTASGDPIHGVKSATVRINMKEAITASIECLSAFRGEAVAEFLVMDPTSGELKRVNFIEFRDGTFFALCECGTLAIAKEWNLVELEPELDSEGCLNRRFAKGSPRFVCEEHKQK
jgi:hypothetical protein